MMITNNELYRKLLSCEDKLVAVLWMMRRFKMTQAELAQGLKDLTAEVQKIGAESAVSLEKITALEDAIANGPAVSQEVQDAFAELKTQVVKVDDMIPDPANP